jgi:hypothetical protein
VGRGEGRGSRQRGARLLAATHGRGGTGRAALFNAEAASQPPLAEYSPAGAGLRGRLAAPAVMESPPPCRCHGCRFPPPQTPQEDPEEKLAKDKRAKLVQREEAEEERQARLLAEQVGRGAGFGGPGGNRVEGSRQQLLAPVSARTLRHELFPPGTRLPHVSRPLPPALRPWQVERARRAAADEGPAEGTELQRDEADEPIKLALGAPGPSGAAAAAAGGGGAAKGARAAAPLFGDEDGERVGFRRCWAKRFRASACPLR